MIVDRERLAAALPNYEVGDEIGRGAFGVVLWGAHRQLGRRVAIKVLSELFASDPGVRRRFFGEARLLASLDHPHIVPIFDYVEHGGCCLLVMELLSGGTVADRLGPAAIRPQAAVDITVTVCGALQHAHDRGVLHRDIKPENLLFNTAGVLKVTDFGIAKVLGGSTTFMTRSGEIVGTPAYMAPEQAAGGQITAGTDVYATATVLYELLSRRLPFAEIGNLLGLLHQRVHDPPLPLTVAAPHVPPAIAQVVMRALARDPDQRHRSAAEFKEALTGAAAACWGNDWNATPAHAATPDPSRPADHFPTAPSPRPTLGPPRREPTAPLPPDRPAGLPASHPRRRRALVVSGALTATLASLAAALLLLVTRPSSARVVFADSFTNPASGWAPDAGQSNGGTATYANGGYDVTVNQQLPALHTYSAGSPYRIKLTAISIRSTVMFLAGRPADAAGVRCDQGSRSGLRYTFQLARNGSWVVFKIDTANTVIKEGTSPDIRTGSATNVLTGECIDVHGGTRLVMVVNGHLLASVTESVAGPPTGWHAALTVYRSGPSSPTEVRFTHFETSKLAN